MAIQVAELMRQPVKVFIETGNGTLYEMGAITTAISAQGERSYKIELDGYGEMTATAKQSVLDRRMVHEWKCDYCGSVNLREMRECPKCGATRSFVYD